MKLNQVVDNREKGQVPVSIGTALAIESAEGIYPDRPPVSPAPILATELLMVNLRTLLRNLIGAIPSEHRSQVKVESIVPSLIEELNILNGIIPSISEGRCRVSFYVSEYRHLTPAHFKGATFKQAVTPKQLEQKKLESDVFSLLAEKPLPPNILHFDGKIEGKFPRTMIITHLPVDLLARYQFEKLELLESHTGAIKPFPMWGTKLSGDTEHLPFNAFTLKLFGDGVQFLGKRPTAKRELLQWAEKDHWTGLTTMDKIRNTVSKIQDKEIRDELTELL